MATSDATLATPNGSHSFTPAQNHNGGIPFEKEELYPVVALTIPRVGAILAQFSADRYVASVYDERADTSAPGWTDWHIVLRDVRRAPVTDEERRYFGATETPKGIGDVARRTIRDAGEPLVRAWLEGPDYATSRRAAAAACARRIIDAPRDYAIDRARKNLAKIAGELDPATVDRYTRALDALAQAGWLLEGIDTVAPPRLIVGQSDEGVIGVTAEGFELPRNATIIVRDYERGSTPDANGDLYEDIEL